ncbi:MAG: tyrosine-type recombinase/integrase [Oscillospiraceae bacterium]|nr:tyrosine-type recombinase/integrase [Oscillospiraceae bacterium]
MRHNCASILISLGFSLKDVQEWLGHADIKMTANIYAHLDVTRKNKVAASLTSNLSGIRGRKRKNHGVISDQKVRRNPWN